MGIGSNRKRRSECLRPKERATNSGCETVRTNGWGGEDPGCQGLVQKSSPSSPAGPTHCQVQARAPESLPRPGSGSRSACQDPAGLARTPGVPAAGPGPAAGVRPTGARSAGGARGPLPSFPPSGLTQPFFARAVPPNLVAQRRVRSLAQQQLQAAAAAPGGGHMQRRQCLDRSGAAAQEGSLRTQPPGRNPDRRSGDPEPSFSASRISAVHPGTLPLEPRCYDLRPGPKPLPSDPGASTPISEPLIPTLVLAQPHSTPSVWDPSASLEP